MHLMLPCAGNCLPFVFWGEGGGAGREYDDHALAWSHALAVPSELPLPVLKTNPKSSDWLLAHHQGRISTLEDIEGMRLDPQMSKVEEACMRHFNEERRLLHVAITRGALPDFRSNLYMRRSTKELHCVVSQTYEQYACIGLDRLSRAMLCQSNVPCTLKAQV